MAEILMNWIIIGSVRACRDEDTFRIEHLI